MNKEIEDLNQAIECLKQAFRDTKTGKAIHDFLTWCIKGLNKVLTR